MWSLCASRTERGSQSRQKERLELSSIGTDGKLMKGARIKKISMFARVKCKDIRVLFCKTPMVYVPCIISLLSFSPSVS
jgi:hypothetical protein